MSEGKDLRVSLLMDFYAPMLTSKQRDMIDLYYNEDLSLGEIAEHEEISRQGVRDSIKRGEQTLFELEDALELCRKSRELSLIADRLSDISGSLEGSKAEELRELAAKIRDIL